MMRTFLIRISAAAIFLAAISLQFGCGPRHDVSSADDRLNKPLAMPPTDKDRPKIIAFGDSLTAGFGLTEQESYPNLLQGMLQKDGFDHEVVNAGVSGDTSLGGLERIDWVLDAPNVHILILELVANDLLRGGPPEKMRQNLETIIQKAKAKNVRVLLCGMIAPPTMGKDYQHDFNAVFPDLAAKYKLQYLPFLLENVALKKELNQADGIHPNAEGEKIMTANVYAALKPMLERRQ